METEIKKLDKIKRVMTIEISGDKLIVKQEEIYKKIGKNLKVPGFRPGHAPMDILKQRHGSVLKEEFLKQAIPFYYEEALKKEELTAVNNPRIYDVEMGADKLTFHAEFEIQPAVEINEIMYKGLKIKRKKNEAKEDEINKTVDSLKNTIEEVTGDKADDNVCAKWAGYPDIEMFKSAVKSDIELIKLKERKEDLTRQVVEALLKKISVEAPESQISIHLEELMRREKYNLMVRGVSEEDMNKYEEDLRKKLKVTAARDVKLFYILTNIAKGAKLNIEKTGLDAVVGYILSLAEFE